MTSEQSSNKRIAKNTVMLYIRMFITLIIGLYTSRVILNALGVEDYGINNVVGGFVSLFSLVSSSMSSSISRFITFELGRGSVADVRKVFATSSIVQIVMSFIIILLSETVGLWFLYNKLVIPEDRMFAAMIVYHLSIVSFIIGILSVPYNAAVVAHEQMGKFAFFSILESIAGLGRALLVKYAVFDKLILYAVIGCAISWTMRFFYVCYCKKHFEECTFSYVFDRLLFKRIFSFAGWNAVGSSASILRNQGSTILLNLFGGPATNAAAGISTTVTGIVNGFVTSFTTAYTPQIVKSFSSGDYHRLHQLIFTFSRLSYYLMLFFSLPIFINARYLLNLWLGLVPDHTVAFVRLVILFMLVEVISQPIIKAKNATGNIRNYQIVVGGILLLALPLSYLSLRLGAPVETVYAANLITSSIAFVARMLMLRDDIPNWSSFEFIKDVVFRTLCVTIVASLVPFGVHIMLEFSNTRFFITCFFSIISVVLTSFYLGLNKEERSHIVTLVHNYYYKR